MQWSDLEVSGNRSLLANLPSKAVRNLYRHAVLEAVPARTVLLREGDVADSLYLLVDGLVELFTTDARQEATILILRPFTFFVTPAVLHDEILPMSARAIRSSRVLRIAASDVRRRVDTDRDFAGLIFRDLTSSCSVIIHELKSLRTKTAFQRLVAWVLAMYDQSQTGSEIELPYDKRLLAARLGMAPETLSRNLAELMSVGVAVRGRKLQIRNAEKLRQLYHSSYPSDLSDQASSDVQHASMP